MNENVININDAINLNNVTDLTNQNDILDPLTPMIEVIMGLDDNNLNEIATEIYKGMLEGIFSETVTQQLIKEIITNLDEMNVAKNEAIQKKNDIINTFKTTVDELKPSAKKRQLLYTYIDQIDSIYDKAFEKYHGANIILPIKLDEGAKMPVYAHDTDACADLFLAEDTTIPAHTMSTSLRTGVHIALPEGWLALIFPRSSIGSKTTLRLSNSVGVIDEEYRGPLGVLYDNVSDSDVTFKQGARIAQMLVMPSYKFKGVQVDELSSTSRGEGGFGSTGK